MPLRDHLGDPELFGNDAGEDEKPEVLASYFVDKPTFGSFAEPKRQLQIARARKGMGKSALLSYLAYRLRNEQPDDIVLQITGADLTGMGEFASDDPALILNQWQQVICARVNMEIGRRLNYAWSDTTVMMVEGAELAGFRGRNLVGALVDRMKGKLGSVEVTKLQAQSPSQLLARYSSDAKAPSVWLLIDDIDSTYLDTPKLRAKISLFFSACRRIVQSVFGLRIRATVRTDVWSSLRDNEDLDKCEQYVTDIHWSADELGTILAKKILAYVKRNDLDRRIAKWGVEQHQEGLIELAFHRRVPWGRASVPPIRPVTILSARRPRWLSQLCRLSGTEAFRTHRDHIGMQEINAILPEFGRLRISDLYKEHAHQFSDIKRLIESFARGPRRYTTSQLLERVLQSYMAKVGHASIPPLDGAPPIDALKLAHFLFKIGFLQGRRDGDVPAFVNYEERPNMLTTSVNPDDGMIWEIYPSYRNVLHIFKSPI